MKEKIVHAFRQEYGENPQWVVRAPGRVNLIGDHTDYNLGLVLPMAIEKAMWIALRPGVGKEVLLHSLDFKETLNLDLALLRKQETGWKEYVKGVAWAMQDAGYSLMGWEGVVAGDIPISSGLSSSAAFQLAIAAAFTVSGGLRWNAEQMAKLVQKAENRWMGVNTGIMDPLISAIAEEGKAALIDCRNLAIRQVNMPRDIAIVIMNTMKSRELVNSAYNERRRQCEEVASHFKVKSLREINMKELLDEKSKLSAILFRRARHILSENDRVIRVADCLTANDPVVAGKLMRESHVSLWEDYEVSCRELDTIVELAIKQPGCYGARMTGAGFGGCAVALVQSDLVSRFVQQISIDYERVIGISPELIVSRPAAGLEISELF